MVRTHVRARTRFARLLDDREITCEALAAQVGCAKGTIHSFRQGWRQPRYPLAKRIGKVLKLSGGQVLNLICQPLKEEE